MTARRAVQQIECVSHGCLMWGERDVGEGRHLEDDEIRSLKRAHALMHRRKQLTVAEIIGKENQ